MFWSWSRWVGMLAFIVSFPPLLSTKNQIIDSLKLSLSAFIFSILTSKKTLNLLYIPSAVSSVFCGLWLIPDGVAWCWSNFLIWSNPFIIIIEGLCAMTAILSLGQLINEWVCSSTTLVAILVALGCITAWVGCIFLISGWLFNLSGSLSIFSISIVVMILTLFLVAIVATLLVEGGSIVDLSLMILYAIYNLRFFLFRNSFGLSTSSFSMSSYHKMDTLVFLAKFLQSFDSEIVTGLIIQFCIFVATAKLWNHSIILTDHKKDCKEIESSRSEKNILSLITGPFIVVSWSAAWLRIQGGVPDLLNVPFWRLINVLVILVIYFYSLKFQNDYI